MQWVINLDDVEKIAEYICDRYNELLLDNILDENWISEKIKEYLNELEV